MKKAFLFIALAATLGGSALQAQDTLEMWDVRDLPNCYIPSEWPRFADDFAYNDYLKRYTVYLSCWGQTRQQ